MAKPCLGHVAGQILPLLPRSWPVSFPCFSTVLERRGRGHDEQLLAGAANALASLVIMLASPLLGAMADRGRAKKRWLLVFSLLGILSTGALSLVAPGQWSVALLLYGLGVIGFSGANAYDALLVVVAGERKLDIVSATGFRPGLSGRRSVIRW